MVWYSHLFQNFPQIVVIHTVKGFSLVNEAEVDVFLEFSSFFYDPMDVGNFVSGSCSFSKSSLNPRTHINQINKDQTQITNIKSSKGETTNNTQRDSHKDNS